MNPVFTQGKWLVAFFDGGEKRWWDVFTRPGFRHCFAVRYLEELDAWVLMDWSSEGTIVEVLPKRHVDSMIVGVNECGGCFLEVDVYKASSRVLPLIPLYCVSAIKELVGLRDWRVITPHQLYCALLKRGAHRMFDLTDTKEPADGKPLQIAGKAEARS